MTDRTIWEDLATTWHLGQASDDQRAAYEALYATNPDFRKLADEIEEFLSPMNAAVPEQAPPLDLFDDIMAEIERAESAPTPSNDNTTPSLEKSLAGWRNAAIAASLIAMIASAAHLPVFNRTAGSASGPTLMATLTDANAPEILVIIYDPGQQKVIAQFTNANPPSDKDWELWLIREGEGGPRSLGLLRESASAGGKAELDLPAPLTSQTDTLAVSLEPRGGAPGDGPSGPVLYTGAVGAL